MGREKGSDLRVGGTRWDLVGPDTTVSQTHIPHGTKPQDRGIIMFDYGEWGQSTCVCDV